MVARSFSAGTLDFNPRSREGSDNNHFSGYLTENISIHAPVKGATRYSGKYLIDRNHFNPRSREGSDRELRDADEWEVLFQSTLP